MDELKVPLVITTDELLIDEVMRLCAAVGVSPRVAAEVSDARQGWADAPCVVVGTDRAAAVADSAPKRRDGVVVAGMTVEDATWPAAIALGAERVIGLPAGQGELIGTLGDAMDGRDDACLIAVVGGAGGAGASTFAGALALVAADRGLRSLLIDADSLGGGIDILMGSEHHKGLRWADVAQTKGRISGESLRQALPAHAGLSTLSYGQGAYGQDRRGQDGSAAVGSEAMRAVLAGGRRCFDVIVADVPRSFDPAATEVLNRAVLAVVVVPETVRALASAARVKDQLDRVGLDAALVTRANPRSVGAETLAGRLSLPLLARIKSDRQLAGMLDAGYGPLSGRGRSLRRGCATVLDTLGMTAA